MLGEGVANQISDSAVDVVDALLEVLELRLPFGLVSFLEHVVRELLKLLHLLSDGVDLVIDLLGASCDLLQVWAEDREELLDDCVSLLEVGEDLNHINGSCEDVLLRLEVPFSDASLLVLDVLLGCKELLPPSREHLLALLDHL